MRPFVKTWMALLVLPMFLASCEFNCKVGGESKVNDGKSSRKVQKDGAIVYNGIEVSTKTVKLKKAWLMFENGERVPDDNFIDFTTPVKLVFELDGGWMETNGTVWLGASEKIIDENNNIVLDEKDLFINYADGISAADARVISLSATIILKQNSKPTSFEVKFRVWDKKGDGEIKGSYTLYSK